MLYLYIINWSFYSFVPLLFFIHYSFMMTVVRSHKLPPAGASRCVSSWVALKSIFVTDAYTP